jgi:signal transduction histidine kinase/ActR/RegA family two-component response regulator
MNKKSRFWIMISAAVFCFIIVAVIAVHNWQRIQIVFDDLNKNSIPLLEQAADLSMGISRMRTELLRYYSDFEPSPNLVIDKFTRIKKGVKEISGSVFSHNNRQVFENLIKSIDHFGVLLDQFIQLRQQDRIFESTIIANQLIGTSSAIASLAKQLNTGIHQDMAEKNIRTQALLLWDTAILSVISGVIVLLLLFGILFQTRLLDKTVQEKTRELKTRLKELGEKKAELQQAQKMESVGRLAGGVAHDFNNMLGVILGHTELALLRTDDKHKLCSDLKEIQSAAKRSADITKQLLAFARKEIISPRQLDLNDTVESMLNMLRRLIGENIDLVWQPDTHICQVKMDPSQIDQILANLCVNARDAIASVGKLTIETERKSFDEEYCKEHPGFIPGDYVLLAVSDNGCGMDKETLDNLFEPFFTTKDMGKGTGLGLATVYGIVKQNNGFINVYSEPDQGSTFRIYLPRLVADEDIDKAVLEKKAAAGGTETILLVEDEPSILRMTRMMLEKKGYSVLPAATPGEAIGLAKTHADKIHLLMTDVVMPEMNGSDLAGEITVLYPGICLLFMSGYTEDIIAHQGVLDDGVTFIQKPFSMADMTQKVREVLDMASDKS